MTVLDFIQIGAYLSLLVVLTPLVGEFMGGVFKGERTFLARIIDPVERLIYRFCGIDPSAEMSWREYAAALLLFNFSGFVVLFAVQLFQSLLPLNPRGLPGVSWHLAFNTAVSFVTNTNWQSYAGGPTPPTALCAVRGCLCAPPPSLPLWCIQTAGWGFPPVTAGRCGDA